MNFDWIQLADYRFTFYALPPLGVGLLVAFVGVTVLIRERSTRISFIFCALTLAASLWLIATALMYASLNEATALRWSRIAHTGVVLTPPLVLAFTSAISRRFGQYKKGVAASFILSCLFVIGIFFTPVYIRGMLPYFWGYHPHYGPLCYLFIFLFFILMFVSLRLFAQEYRRTPTQTHKRRLESFLIAFSIGYIASVDFLAGFNIPIYPFGYVPVFISLLMIARTIWLYHLVDITPSFAASQIIATMVTPLIVCDADGIIRVVNDRTCETFGYKQKELLGKPIEILMGPSQDDRRQLQNELKNLLVKDHEMIFRTQKGEPVAVSVSIAHLYGHTRTKLGSVIIASDIRERRKNELAMLKKNFELAQSNAELEQLELFAFVASHDLREPLQKIIGFGELLKKHCADSLSPDGQDYLDRMIKATLRMNQLIEDLLKFSKMAMKAEPAELTPVNLEELLKEIVSDLETNVVETKAEIRWKDLPIVHVNYLQIHQLFQNLIGNALKFHKKDEAPEILIQGKSLPNGFVEVTIEDNGIGFDEKYIQKIFKPFERLHGRSEFEGSGLGLAICQKIVANHGGHITVKSTPGKGSTFIFTLPQESI